MLSQGGNDNQLTNSIHTQADNDVNTNNCQIKEINTEYD